ncbi:repeat protein [Moumouvirus goulette]|uniref:Repeat protein n=1 Tax=Moumouvirus goulette TaxID=1247379 RepID=M1PCL5_9VIRU|nr:repeat protein [Moumouvirus goulette]AGF85739.1 repeat protein [Moumouvirus goulette]
MNKYISHDKNKPRIYKSEKKKNNYENIIKNKNNFIPVPEEKNKLTPNRWINNNDINKFENYPMRIPLGLYPETLQPSGKCNLKQVFLFESIYERFYSSCHNKKQIPHIFLKNKIKIYEKDDYNKTHLMCACKYSFGDSNLQIIKYLIKEGLDVNVIDIYGKNVFYYALIREGNFRIIKLLTKYITDKSCLNRILLHWAKTNYLPDIKIADVLLKAGANINVVNKYNETLLMLIIKNKSYQNIINIVKYLLINGINIEKKSNLNPKCTTRELHSKYPCLSINYSRCLGHNFDSEEYSILDYYFSRHDIIKDDKIYHPMYVHMNKIRYSDPVQNKKILQLLLDYGCEYKNYMDKFDDYSLKIIKSISHSQKYYSTVIDEIKYIRNCILFKPGSIRYKMCQIKWDLQNGSNYYQIKNKNDNLFVYFGISEIEKFNLIFPKHNKN